MFEAYRVAVRVSLVNQVTAGLITMSRQFAQVHGQVGNLQGRLNSLKLTMLKGGALVGAGAVGFGLLAKTLTPAKEYAHQLALMNVSGLEHVEVLRSIQAAWNATRVVPTTLAADNLAAIRELRMVFGDTQHAIANMPMVQKLQAVLKDFRGDVGAATDEAYTVAKALEMKGAVRNPQEFGTQANLMLKAIVASGGKVTGGDFLSTFKYGRAATAGWSDEFAYQILPTLIQEMKSSGGSGGSGGPGSSLMSAFAAVVGGTVPQKALKVWEKLGLLNPSKVVYDRVGSAKGLRPGGIKGGDLFQANPYQWVQDVLLPAFKRAGYDDDKKKRGALQYLFPNRTAGFVMQQMALQSFKFERDRSLIRKASGLEAYDRLLKTDPEMAQAALHTQWKNLLATLGFQIMPTVLRWTQRLIGGLQSLGAFFRNHSTLAKVLMFSLAGLSAAMMFGGTVLLLSAAVRGLGLALGVMGGVLPAFSTGLAGVAGIAGLSALGPILLAIAAGLGAVYVVSKVIKTLDTSSNVDEKHHPGMRFMPTGHGGHWVRDASLDQTHFGQHWVPIARGGGKWVADDAKSPGVMPRAQKQPPVEVTTNIHLDGERVSRVVTKHQARSASRAVTGAAGFDPQMHPLQPGMVAPQ